MKTESQGRAQTISTVTATAIVVANMIGTGVFTSLGFQITGTPSDFALLLLWFIGGVLALCGAMAYAELAAALPRSGGEYHFLSEIFHPAVGFMAGWISATVGFAAPIALAAIAFGSYLHGAFPDCPQFALTLAIVWLTSLVHLSPLKLISTFQNLSTLFKIAAILLIIAAGFCIGQSQPVSFFPTATDTRLVFSAPFAISLVYVMYSYSGWNASTYIVNEIRDPQHGIPRSVFWGTLAVMLLYMGLNAAFLYAAPMEKMSGQLQVGLIAGKYIFGETGGRVMAGIICLGLVSSVSSMTWIGPRVTMAMGEDFHSLRLLAWKNRNGVPIVAVLLQLSIATLLLTANFSSVLDYIQFSLILCSSLTVLGVIVLRIRRPGLARPYKTWGYPVTPLLFLAISGYTMFYLFRSQPHESLASLGTMLAGLLIYFASPKKSPNLSAKSSANEK